MSAGMNAFAGSRTISPTRILRHGLGSNCWLTNTSAGLLFSDLSDACRFCYQRRFGWHSPSLP